MHTHTHTNTHTDTSCAVPWLSAGEGEVEKKDVSPKQEEPGGKRECVS